MNSRELWHGRPGTQIVYAPRAIMYYAVHAVPAGRASLLFFFARCTGEGRSTPVVASLAPWRRPA